MNAAERLFAERGFEHTSTHLITRVAGVNQAAVNYHFGTKDRLIEEVVRRRLSPVSQKILTNLQLIETEAVGTGLRPKTEDVLHAFIEPLFKMKDAFCDGRIFFAIAGRAFAEQDNAIQNIFKNYYQPVLSVVLRLLKKSMPDFPDRLLYFRIHFAFGAVTHTMSLLGREWLMDDFPRPPYNEEEVLKGLSRFIVAGIKSIDQIVEQE